METTADGGNEPTPESLDDCGLRFLLALKHFSYLKRCLPLAQRKQLQKQGMASLHLIWGYHSESEDELLAMVRTKYCSKILFMPTTALLLILFFLHIFSFVARKNVLSNKSFSLFPDSLCGQGQPHLA